MNKNAGRWTCLLVIVLRSGSIVSAQAVDPLLPIISSPADKGAHEMEKPRVQKAAVSLDDSGETVYTINGNDPWRRTDKEVKRGQRVEISAGGVVRWAQDGIENIEVTPDGTRPPYRDGWNHYHFPFPEAGIGSLVMRIGKGIYPVGSGRVIEAEDDGFIEFMINDDELDDNSGSFAVKVKLLPRSEN
jgi:hypothetical protein